MDEKIPKNVSSFDTTMSDSNQLPYARDIQMIPEHTFANIAMKKESKSREEIYAESHFEWIKTERQGDICRFKNFLFENDSEYVVFQDGSRVRSELVGDVVLMHQYPEEILGFKSDVAETVQAPNDTIFNHIKTESIPFERIVEPVVQVSIDPVKEIYEKSKKKTEKVTLTISLKILPPDLYHVIKENFENVDDVLLQTAMDQIHDSLLREALKKELQSIYQKRRKTQ